MLPGVLSLRLQLSEMRPTLRLPIDSACPCNQRVVNLWKISEKGRMQFRLTGLISLSLAAVLGVILFWPTEPVDLRRFDPAKFANHESNAWIDSRDLAKPPRSNGKNPKIRLR